MSLSNIFNIDSYLKTSRRTQQPYTKQVYIIFPLKPEKARVKPLTRLNL